MATQIVALKIIDLMLITVDGVESQWGWNQQERRWTLGNLYWQD